MDSYDRRARLAPLAVTVAPLTLLAAGAIATTPTWWARLIGAAALLGSGLPLLAINFVRDLGTAEQARLWEAWGGRPTTSLLRWKTASNKLVVQRRHQHLSRVTGMSLPSQAQEEADPTAADQTYEVATDELKELTQSKEQFPMIATEVAQYGFRRNLYSLRRLGRAAALVSLLGAVGAVGLIAARDFAVPLVPLAIVVAVDVLWIFGWNILISATFVRRSADRYAERLVASAATLPARQE